MKKRPKIIAVSGIILTTLAVWSLGYVMGNTAATRRTGQTELYKNVAILKAIEGGDTDKAKSLCATLISGGYRFLQTKPFWVISMQDQFRVDSEGLYERIAHEAEVIADRSVRDSVPLDHALKEGLGHDAKIEYNYK